ncbi:hypothetical protein [Novosphingobium sp. Leaf2]|uniref:hypothetical protein n=1 Tax=Novosphingobium sp. Leaf2 TaxID=1735670 RepID=UPI00070170E0|nr:hypothetical protein [Novosphingobium sp. Leaf2]KQM18703.1 hypothetical protein ASE49_05935 [Novosphingobium sp. Leaf2]
MKYTTLLMAAAVTLGGAGSLSAQQTPAAPVSAGSAAGEKALADPDVVTVRNVNRVELTQGLPIVDDNGQPVGTVSRLAGNDVILTDGTAEYRVPFTKIYAFNRDGADYFASRLSLATLKGKKPRRH